MSISEFISKITLEDIEELKRLKLEELKEIPTYSFSNITFSEMKGAYIVGEIWNFVILERVGENSYQYFVSKNFDSTKIDDLVEIYKNLLFVKEKILKGKKWN